MRRATWRTGQQTPTPERYREIQQALIEKGFLQAPATGVWGPDSIEALRKFQEEQNLTPDGKLDALSLIALGLGPRREANGSSAGGIPALTPAAGSAPGSNGVPASPSVSRLGAAPSKANPQTLQ